MEHHHHVVVMGVSGSGKTTVAHGIRDAMGLLFAEADEFHSDANIEKMKNGTPLTDQDRWPWLEALGEWMGKQAALGRDTVIACSALRKSYRDVLRSKVSDIEFVHLHGPPEVIRERMSGRRGHYMPASLLDSQVATLEPLQDDETGLVLDLREPVDRLVDAAVEWLRSRDGERTGA